MSSPQVPNKRPEGFYTCPKGDPDSYSHRAKTAEKQMQKLAELQHKLNSQTPRVSTIKVRVLTEKEWDSVSWDGDMWEDTDETGYTKPLNFDKSLPGEVASPLPTEAASSAPLVSVYPPPVLTGFSTPTKVINPSLPKESIMAFPEAVAIWDNADSP